VSIYSFGIFIKQLNADVTTPEVSLRAFGKHWIIQDESLITLYLLMMNDFYFSINNKILVFLRKRKQGMSRYIERKLI